MADEITNLSAFYIPVDANSIYSNGELEAIQQLFTT
jgi:hypothetical protein